jgi:hypothetical protein
MQWLLSEYHFGMSRCWMGIKGSSQSENRDQQSNGSNGNAKRCAHANAPPLYPEVISPLDFNCMQLVRNEGN